MSKAIVVPSGFTSTDIQLPSLVSNAILRAGFSGKLLKMVYFTESFRVVSPVATSVFHEKLFRSILEDECCKAIEPNILEGKAAIRSQDFHSISVS